MSNLSFFYMNMLDFMMILIMIIPSNLYKFHPLFLSLLLIFYVLFMCLKMNFLESTYWYSYILYLVMIGGMMILFMYFTSLASNQIFEFNWLYLFFLVIKISSFMVFLLMLYKNDQIKIKIIYMYSEINSLVNFDQNFQMLMMKNLLMDYLMDLNLYLVFYLFFMMVCVMMICSKIMIPLRQLYNL